MAKSPFKHKRGLKQTDLTKGEWLLVLGKDFRGGVEHCVSVPVYRMRELIEELKTLRRRFRGLPMRGEDE